MARPPARDRLPSIGETDELSSKAAPPATPARPRLRCVLRFGEITGVHALHRRMEEARVDAFVATGSSDVEVLSRITRGAKGCSQEWYVESHGAWERVDSIWPSERGTDSYASEGSSYWTSEGSWLSAPSRARSWSFFPRRGSKNGNDASFTKIHPEDQDQTDELHGERADGSLGQGASGGRVRHGYFSRASRLAAWMAFWRSARAAQGQAAAGAVQD
mmetsp:Transcript_37651/g.108522  ORF Transcript_37651/g.108522 Transcript_37651/m.108522 type:complete len:218 (-) Transcript_37651:401-1054(-)